MAKFSRGMAAEGRLITKLKEYGCQIIADASMDHEKKLDFVVLSLPEFPSLLAMPLGVQVTLQFGDNQKKDLFFLRTRKNPYAPKNLYLELDGEVNLEEGGAFAVLAAITQFLIDRRFRAWTVGAVCISQNLTYEFSTSNGTIVSQAPPLIPDVSEPPVPPSEATQIEATMPTPVNSPEASANLTKPPDVQLARFATAQGAQPEALRLTSVPESPSMNMPPPANVGALRFSETTQRGTFGVALSKAMGVTLLSGRITRFNPELGIGIIASTGGNKMEYFLHWKNVGDPELLTTLNDLPRQQRLLDPIAVQFADGGTSDGKKNRKALDIKRLAR